MAAGMGQGLQDAAALKKRFERFGAVFFVAKVCVCVCVCVCDKGLERSSLSQRFVFVAKVWSGLLCRKGLCLCLCVCVCGKGLERSSLSQR